MGTLIACSRVHRDDAELAPQTVIVDLCAASASIRLPLPRARVCVPEGRAGSSSQLPPGPLSISPRPPDSTSPTEPPGPNDADSTCLPCALATGDRTQRSEPRPVHAATTVAFGSLPTASSAVSRSPVVLSRSTVTG